MQRKSLSQSTGFFIPILWRGARRAGWFLFVFKQDIQISPERLVYLRTGGYNLFKHEQF